MKTKLDNEVHGSQLRLLIVVAATALLFLAAHGCSKGEPKPISNQEKPHATGSETASGQTLGERIKGKSGPKSAIQGLDALMDSEIKPDPNHRPTRAEDRQLLAGLYVAFSLDPGAFIAKVEAAPSETRKQVSGFLLCAALKLADASRDAPLAGAPAPFELPEAANELIEFSGSKERAKKQFLKQLSGEFLVLGRAIRAIDAGSVSIVKPIIERQKANLKMLELTAPPDKRVVWRSRVEKVFPMLFAELLPQC